MRKIPTHLLYLQHFDHEADENLMSDEYVAVDMMQINQGEPCFSVWVSFTFFSTYFCSIWSKKVQFAASLLTNTLMSSQLLSMKYCQESSDIKLFLTENVIFINLDMKYTALKTCHSKGPK